MSAIEPAFAHGWCAKCKHHGLPSPLHGEKGGPMVCFTLNSMADELCLLPPIEVPEIDLGEPPDPLVSTQRLKMPLSCAGQRRGSCEVKAKGEVNVQRNWTAHGRPKRR